MRAPTAMLLILCACTPATSTVPPCSPPCGEDEVCFPDGCRPLAGLDRGAGFDLTVAASADLTDLIDLTPLPADISKAVDMAQDILAPVDLAPPADTARPSGDITGQCSATGSACAQHSECCAGSSCIPRPPDYTARACCINQRRLCYSNSDCCPGFYCFMGLCQ